MRMNSREEEIDYAKEKNIDIDVTEKCPYSLDHNLWGISIECGKLEDPWNEPPKDAYRISVDPKTAPNKPLYIEIEFKKGVPIKINKKKYSPVELISKLNKLGGAHGIGRTDLVENRLIGIKSREIYEAPAVISILVILLILMFPQKAYAYLDAGTGSYIFQLVAAILFGGLFAVKLFWNKIRMFFRNLLSGRKKYGKTKGQ